MIVVADTSPLNYLVLIGHIDILRTMYGEVIIPPAVQDELLSSLAPAVVRLWITSHPHGLKYEHQARSTLGWTHHWMTAS